jgi:hypothetical protein
MQEINDNIDINSNLGVKMKKLSILISYILSTAAFANSEEIGSSIADLAGLSLEELMRVEVISLRQESSKSPRKPLPSPKSLPKKPLGQRI